MTSEQQVIIVGGGASGLMAAGAAAQAGSHVTLIERNARPARKVLITGKGRCNVTNDCGDIRTLVEAVPANGRFLYSAFSAFMPAIRLLFLKTQVSRLRRSAAAVSSRSQIKPWISRMRWNALHAGAASGSYRGGCCTS